MQISAVQYENVSDHFSVFFRLDYVELPSEVQKLDNEDCEEGKY